jgi:hypothetical protein
VEILISLGKDPGTNDTKDNIVQWPFEQGSQIPHQGKIEKPRQNRPPKPLNASRLLNKFLNELFPTGVTFVQLLFQGLLLPRNIFKLSARF